KGTPEFELKPSKAAGTPKAAPTAAPRSRTSETSSFKERRELTKAVARLERHIARLENEIADGEQRIQARDQELASETLYQDHERRKVLVKDPENRGNDHSAMTPQRA